MQLFEEYTWCASCMDENLYKVSEFFPDLIKRLKLFSRSFWDLNNFLQVWWGL